MQKSVIRFWFERARLMTRRMLDRPDWPDGPDLELRHSGGLEPMNAAEWLLSCAGHEALHHRQIDDVLALMHAVMDVGPAEPAVPAGTRPR